MARRIRLLMVAVVWGLVWGALVARWYDQPMLEGARLGVLLFCPGMVLALRPVRHSAMTFVRVPEAPVHRRSAD